MDARLVPILLCLLSMGLAAQDPAAARLLCDPAEPEHRCPGEFCRCTDDSMELLFDETGASILELDRPAENREFQVGVFLEVQSDLLNAWFYGVAHDEGLLELRSATFAGTFAEKLPNSVRITTKDNVFTCKPPFESKCEHSEAGGGYVSAVVLGVGDISVLPRGRHLVSRATYALRAEQLSRLSTSISFSDVLRTKDSNFPFRIAFLSTTNRSFKPTFVQDGHVIVVPHALFHRGDPDGDGRVSVLDAVQVLLFLFLAGPAPSCFEAADFDDDGRIDASDPILILRWLLLHGSAPAAPGPPGSECGRDRRGSPAELGCGDYTAC